MFRNSSTYIYLAVALGLFCYLTFIDKKIPGTKEREEAETQLFNFNPDDVTGLEITNLHGLFIFQKINNHWEIKKPVNTPADGATVDGVINQIAFAQPQRIIQVDGSSDKDTANLKEWGLIPPAERVVIHTQDKSTNCSSGAKWRSTTASMPAPPAGKTSRCGSFPARSRTSCKKTSPISAAAMSSISTLDKATKVATRIADTVHHSRPQGQQCEVDLKDGKWTLQLPLVARASDTDVQALLNKILGQRAVDFVTDDASNLSPYGLTSPSRDPLRHAQDRTSEWSSQIGGPVPNKPDQVYAQRLKSNSVFTLTKSSVDDLLKAVPNVRDRHVLPFDPNKAPGLSLSFGTKKGQVRADHALWNTVGDAEGPADVGKVTDLLARLSQLETTPVLKDSATDLKPFGLDKPQGKITIQSPEFKPGPSLTLLIGKAENKLLYVRNSAEPFIYTVPDNAFDFLPANNLALRDARAINLKLEPGQEHDDHRRFRAARHPHPQPGRHLERRQRQGPHGRLDQGRHPGQPLLPIAGQDLARPGAARLRPDQAGPDHLRPGRPADAHRPPHRRRPARRQPCRADRGRSHHLRHRRRRLRHPQLQLAPAHPQRRPAGLQIIPDRSVSLPIGAALYDRCPFPFFLPTGLALEATAAFLSAPSMPPAQNEPQRTSPQIERLAHLQIEITLIGGRQQAGLFTKSCSVGISRAPSFGACCAA